MIADLKPYPVMKDSGVEWLGEVPESWEVRRNGRLFAQRNETGFADLCILEVSLRTGVRVRDFENSGRKQVMSDRDKYKRALAGDIAYNMMRMWQGAVGVAPVDGLISPAYVVARPLPGTETRYFERLFRTPMYMQEVDNYSRGIVKDRNRLYWEDFKAMPTCYPPPIEQAAIVRYLDHVDRRVRRLVRAKQKLIGLLEEQKKAIIHRAVTRGLDPDVPLTPSGVEWLGDMPEHWEVKRLKSIARIRYGLGQPPRETANGLPLIRATNVERGRIVEKDLLRVDPSDVPTSRNAFLCEGEIIVVRSGAYTADSAIIPTQYDGAVTGYDMVVTVIKARQMFIAQVLLCSYVLNDQLIVASMRSAQPHLNAEELGAALILLPPLREQTAIVQYLDKATADIEVAAGHARREIELLREYRTRLIADVVTGKLDVREAAANLPEETDESEPLHETDDVLNGDEDMADELDAIPEEAEA